jgi:hypothetical protein
MMQMKLTFNILFFIILQFGSAFSQGKSQYTVKSNPAELLPFVQPIPKVDSASLSKLIGLEFPENLQISNVHTRHFFWNISKQPNYTVYECVVDTLHIFFLEKRVKSNPNPNFSILKIVSILTVVNDDPDQFIKDVSCSQNKIVDDRIIALVKLPTRKKPSKYFVNVIRAWRVNTDENRFDEISPKNIRCLNEYLND